MTAVQQGNLDRAARNRAIFTIEARRLLAQGEPARAAELCRRGLVHFPNDHLGYVLLAQAYLMLGLRDRAALVLGDGYRRTGSQRLARLRSQIETTTNPDREGARVEPPAQESDDLQTDRLAHDVTANEAVTAPAAGIAPAIEEPADTVSPLADVHAEDDGAEDAADFASEPHAEEVQSATWTEAPDAGETATATVETVLLMAEEPTEQMAPAEEEIVRDDAEFDTERDAQTIEMAEPVLEPAETALDESELAADDAGVFTNDLDGAGQHELSVVSPADQEPAVAEITVAPDAIEPSVEATAEALAIEAHAAVEAPIAEPPATEQISPEPAATVAEESIAVDSEPVMQEPEPPVPNHVASLSVASHPEPPATPARKPEPEAPRPRLQSLALHTVKNASRLRSSNLRLIPGLEFAPLRHEDPTRRQLIAPLINEPMPQPEITRRIRKTIDGGELPPLPPLDGGHNPLEAPAHSEERAPSPQPQTAPVSPLENIIGIHPRAEESLTPLEELARRLEHARIPAVEEPEQHAAFQPSLVSETLADILVRQGAFAEALKAYQTLARANPERLAHYQQRITEVQQRIRDLHEAAPDS